MNFQILVIQLLVAILDRVMFPKLLDTTRDRKHQFLMSECLEWCNTMEKILKSGQQEER